MQAVWGSSFDVDVIKGKTIEARLPFVLIV